MGNEWDSEDWKTEDEETELSAEDERLVQEIIDCLKG